MTTHRNGGAAVVETPAAHGVGAIAAEAFVRVTGRPGGVVATGGPGLTNTMTAAASAYAESQPMLIVSSDMPTGSEGQDLGQLHEAKNICAVS